MKSKFMIFFVFMIYVSLWTTTECAELSSVPAVFLKPILLFNRTIIASILSRPDYVCRMSQQAKDKLCELVFTQKDLVARYKIQYGDKLDKNGYDFKCQVKIFYCILDTIYNLGLSQEMLLCPVINSENGNVVNNYYLSTNYTSNEVIIFEAGNDGRVFAVVGVNDLNLEELNKQTTNTSS